MGGARLIGGCVRLGIIGLDQFVREEKGLDLFATHVSKHTAVDLDAGAEHLTTLFDHFLALSRIVDDVTIFKREVVFAHDHPNPLAPAARWL